MGKIDEFQRERERLNQLDLSKGNLEIKRFFSLDSQVYRQGAIPTKYKEILGLVASLVLRCDDCIMYHIIRCHEEGVSQEEFNEAMAIALVVGGSITIPHLRRAYDAWEELQRTSR